MTSRHRHYLTPTGELRERRRRVQWRLVGAFLAAFAVTALSSIGAMALVFLLNG